jgi:DNA invertase Pin-like site-specific DNA recombinase
MMRERQREGIERAKREGKYRGRAPHARRRADEVRELRQQGYGPARIARELGIGRTSVYRILKDQEGQGEAA